MASKQKLQGAFGSLSDTLTFRFDPSLPEGLVGRWVAAMAHAAAIADRVADWNALPADAPEFDAAAAALDNATHALVVAGSTGERLGALDRADNALAAVERLLNRA